MKEERFLNSDCPLNITKKTNEGPVETCSHPCGKNCECTESMCPAISHLNVGKRIIAGRVIEGDYEEKDLPYFFTSNNTIEGYKEILDSGKKLWDEGKCSKFIVVLIDEQGMIYFFSRPDMDNFENMPYKTGLNFLYLDRLEVYSKNGIEFNHLAQETKNWYKYLNLKSKEEIDNLYKDL